MWVFGGKNILDNIGIYFESYFIVKDILMIVYFLEKEFGIEEVVEKLIWLFVEKLVESLLVGEEMLVDILVGLIKFGWDMCDEMLVFLLCIDVLSMEDLKLGMELIGMVCNVIDFGVFVDIGVK